MTKIIAKENKNLTPKTTYTPPKEELLQHLLQAKTKLKRMKDVDSKRTQEILSKDIHVKSIARATQLKMDTLQNRKSSISKEQVLEETVDIVYDNFDILSGSLDIVKVYVDDLFEKMEAINLTLNKVIDVQRIQLTEGDDL
jgi:hypothetical protein